MMKHNFFTRPVQAWKSFTGFFRAFLIIAAAFLIVGVGTLGSLQATGKSYELPAKQSADHKNPEIILELFSPEGYENKMGDINVVDVLLNVGTVYSSLGTPATLRVGHATKADSEFYTYSDVTVANVYQTDEKGTAITGALYNWISVAENASGWNVDGYSLSTYNFYSFRAKTCNVTLNEIVIVGVDTSLEKEEQKLLLIPTAVDEHSMLYDENASAVIDSQKIPAMAQSSYFRFGEEEVYSLMSINEMRKGNSFAYNSFHGDKVYNVLGTDILAFGTLIFGLSPFGLRIFPMLASFGILIVGYCLTKKLTGSEKAGLIFAVLYALCGFSLSLGHLGTPLTLGLFFFLCSLSACVSFYQNGMKNASFAGAKNAILSGLFGAFALCVNGAYILPMLGVIGVFVAGMLKQNKAKQAVLNEQIAIAEQAIEEGDEESELIARQNIANTLNEASYKERVAPAMFASFLVLGALFVTMLCFLPAYHLYVRMYSNTDNLLAIVGKVFIGGFIGNNPTGITQSAWSLLYTLFRGTGEGAVALTATGLLPAVMTAVAGIIGIVLCVIDLVKSKEKKFSVIFALAGIVLSVICSFVGKGALAFSFATYLFSYIAVAIIASRCEKMKKWQFTLAIVLLCVCFALFAVFTFSIPLPASWIVKF